MLKTQGPITENPSINGLAVFASAGPAREEIIPDQDPSIVDWVTPETPASPRWKIWQRRSQQRQYQCGHTGPRYFSLRIWGRRLTIGPKVAHLLCPDCSLNYLKENSFRCCLCGLAVIPGEPVAVYDAGSVREKDFEFKVVEGYALGCMLWNCCPTAGFFAGNWMGNRVKWYGENEE